MQRDGDSSDLPPESRTSGPGRVGSEREDARAAEPSGSANAAEGPEVSVPADDPRPSGATFERRPPGSIPRPTRASTGYFPGEDKHPVLITEAAPSLEQQHRARVKRYMILM
ncbi:DUF3099 domain-containing protein, partial [Micromonospora sp. NPDC047620]